MASWIFQAPASPDRFLGRLAQHLEGHGYRLLPGPASHLVAWKQDTVLYVHAATRPEGILVEARAVVPPFARDDIAIGTVYESARDAQVALTGRSF